MTTMPLIVYEIKYVSAAYVFRVEEGRLVIWT